MVYLSLVNETTPPAAGMMVYGVIGCHVREWWLKSKVINSHH
ncbi:MAG: hypothetical protein ORN57_01985 [Alphaproteobacteria bacterium]|nr:hypothetical protein [Alphaproteobacteria bacterium]